MNQGPASPWIVSCCRAGFQVHNPPARGVCLTNTSQRFAPWFWRVLSLFLILSAALLSPIAVGVALATDEEIRSPSTLLMLGAGRIVLLLAGVALLVRPPRQAPFLFVRLPALAATVLLAGFGLFAAARQREWIHPRVLSITEIRDRFATRLDPMLGDARIHVAETSLAKAEREHAPPARLVEIRRGLADYLLRVGRIEDATRTLEGALRTAQDAGLPVKDVNLVRRSLGIAHLRTGELSNCVHGHNPERCIFPIKGGGVWADPKEADAAAGQFQAGVEADPDDLAARWLLNIAHMVKGDYPGGVPPSGLIPPAAFQSAVDVPRFRDIALKLGVSPVGLAGGAVMDDIDGDGFLDLVVSGYDPANPMHYYHNDGDGSFSDRTEAAGLSGQLGGFNLDQTDYNNDGRLDLFLIRGAWLRAWGRQRNSLLRQNEDGTFTDVTLEAGMGDYAYPNITAAWADYDNDGDLDVYVGGEILSEVTVSPCALFRNNGDGTFTDVARRAGVVNWANTKGLSWGDYDNDGDQDLYVSNLGLPNRLYRNDGNGRFTDVAPELGVARVPPSDRTFAAWFWDVNNDGWLDLFVAGYGVTGGQGAVDVGLVAADYLGRPADSERLHLHLNDGTGHFKDVSHGMNLDKIRAPMGANYGDIDNDGFLDIYLGTGGPSYDLLVPNVLYKNMGGTSFADVTTAAGVGHLQKGHGVAFGDIDNDGDQDIFVEIGGLYRADVFNSALFENPGNRNHWLTVRLVGVRSNRPGIGARIRVSVEEGGSARDIYALAGSGGSFGASSLQQEIGLGGAQRVRELEVRWPATGIMQVLHDVPMDGAIEITEGRDGFRALESKRLALAPATDGAPGASVVAGASRPGGAAPESSRARR